MLDMKLHIKTQGFKKGVQNLITWGLSTAGTRRQSDKQQDNSERVTQKGHTDMSSLNQLSTFNNKGQNFWHKTFQHLLMSVIGRIQTKGFIYMAEESKPSV